VLRGTAQAAAGPCSVLGGRRAAPGLVGPAAAVAGRQAPPPHVSRGAGTAAAVKPGRVPSSPVTAPGSGAPATPAGLGSAPGPAAASTGAEARGSAGQRDDPWSREWQGECGVSAQLVAAAGFAWPARWLSAGTATDGGAAARVERGAGQRPPPGRRCCAFPSFATALQAIQIVLDVATLALGVTLARELAGYAGAGMVAKAAVQTLLVAAGLSPTPENVAAALPDAMAWILNQFAERAFAASCLAAASGTAAVVAVAWRAMPCCWVAPAWRLA